MGKAKLVAATDFLRRYDNLNTRKNYKVGIKLFFELVYPELRGEDLDGLAERYLSGERGHREDMLNFRESLKDKSPNTKALRFNAVRVFLDDNGIKDSIFRSVVVESKAMLFYYLE